MRAPFFLSLTAFSLILSSLSCADESVAVADEVAQVENTSSAEKPAAALKKEEAPKRVKAHYAGARRKEPKKEAPEAEKKRTSHVKNEWFSSKTHPKAKKKEAVEADVEIAKDLPEDRPYFRRADHRYSAPLAAQSNASGNTSPEINHLEKKVEAVDDYEEGFKFPHRGFEAPMACFFVTGEYLYWRVRQEGMEFVPSKKLHFDFDSGFRTGLGVHLPHDGWDLYVNYTRYTTSQSSSAHGAIFPLMLYAATNFVEEAHAHWNFKFQTADLEIGRVFYASKTLILRPFFGIRGAWIDQHAHVRYEGGIVPSGEEYRVGLRNDFRGGGPLLGFQSRWILGSGFSFFGNGAAALVIGEFNNRHKQQQSAGFIPIDLNTNLRLVTSAMQMGAGLAWDRNFCTDRCHFGLCLGFEAQYWTDQNQIEQFTTPAQPYFVRENGDLALYGLTLRARFDF